MMIYPFKKTGKTGSASRGKKQWISTGLLFVFLMGIISSGLVLGVPAPAFASAAEAGVIVAADAAKGACTPALPCPAVGVAETTKSLWDRVITPSLKMLAVKALIDFVSFASNRIAYEAAVYIANGGPGEGSMFYNKSASDGFTSFRRDLAGQAFGNLSDFTKESFGLDLCVPQVPLIRLNLQLSIKQSYTVQKPKCDFASVKSQWRQIVSDASALIDNDKNARDDFLFNKLAEGLRPGNNELGASIGFLQLTDEKAQKEAEIKKAEQIGSIPIGGFTNVKDLVTGQTKTPASIVAKQFDDQLKAAKGDENKIKPTDVLAHPDVWYGLLGMSVSTFTNTLTSQLFNRVYKGLFSPQPENEDPFKIESVGGSNINAIKADLGGIFTATPVANPQFDLLSEFAQCTPDGTGNRGLNSCVIDVSVVSAISRGGSAGALTVQEAIDQKVLNGDWPLISPKDQSANSDRLCYTYGFCYANLVKLRKARIVSIGWELAAEKNSLSNPASLNSIVAGFYDEKSPWYHLIDPNWVLKAPETQCRASVNGEIRVSAQAAGRQSVCADAPTCIGEDSTGKCVQGFGYCVQEKNIWRVKGDECPAQYATCLTFANTHSGKTASYLLNTVDNANCTKQNAGCLWNKTQKVADAKGVFQWFTGSSAYDVDATSNTFRFASSSAANYSYQDRLYVTHAAKQCDQTQAGCTELNLKNGSLSLNLVQNGSLEKDEDKNGKPDSWSVEDGGFELNQNEAVDGSVSIHPIALKKIKQLVSVVPGGFYTFSLYTGVFTGQSGYVEVQIDPLTSTGAATSIAGLSFSSSTCSILGSGYRLSENGSTPSVYSGDGWKRFACTFTLPQNASQLLITLGGGTNVNASYDAVKLESGEVASSFGDGYNTASPAKTYLKIAPSYLGCKGLENDPAECSDYAPVCSALDVGCNLYAPKESGPSVSAIASALDACPNTCVGYDSYRQEGTKYEPAKFPVHFIADKAGVCSANAIGCDGFTKLGTNGGETQEYYTNLRACLTPEMADGSQNKTSATYFTWEGSDNSGFQLKTWQLLQSDVNGSPCVNSSLESESSVKCVETKVPVLADSSCDTHMDIFTNPDCREFFDNDGDIHYRLFSKTITVDSACAAYRKNTSTASDCSASGGFWTSQGFCRYFGLQKESKVCSVSENGCREYTGGAGRNATTILTEEFEGGTTGLFAATASATAQPSNESVSSGGHSVRVIASNNDTGMQTIPTALSSNLIKGKVYTMQFWAKGTDTLSAGFTETNGTKHYFVENMPLSNTWSVFTVGPMDTSGFATFDKDAKLFFTTKSGKEFFVDNITLTQAAENITRIKDSWVTPAVCDQSPSGAVSPQYYLGCKAYTDRKGKEESYYQFTRVCSEKAIGCSAYYNTYNSESAYAQVTNARCVNLGVAGVPTGTQVGTLPIGKAATGNVACVVGGITYCTISAGQNYCVFSSKQAFTDPLPSNASFGIVYGPETVVTPQDQSIFLVDNGNAQCGEAFKGCREVGAPTYAQDLKTVTKFESKYVLDTPDDYKNILCENQALFCDEFSSTKDGNFYFKNPLDKTCEYKTSVSIKNKSFSGWFRSGKSEPCYWTDKSNPKNNVFDPGIDSAYLISGDQSQIWKNGDIAYDGWIGACDTSANRCTELIDATDTSPENHGKGKSYYVINNDKLLENSVTLTQKCEGKVGQKAGCALFDNTTISQRKYNASASYVLSVHADLLLNKPENSLVDPISCAQGGGVFPISKETAEKIGTPTLTSVDLCAQRCEYKIPQNDTLLSSGLVTVVGADKTTTGYERSCLMVSDCPTLKTKLGGELKATACKQVAQRVSDDANTVLKVNRDRTCAAWLACDSSRTAWDAGSNKYIQICDSVNLCTQVGSHGDQAQCQSWTERPAVVMTEKLYASRDVSWAGTDYSGYEIPHQMPVEQFTQFNVNPKKWCKNKNTLQCDTKDDCSAWGGDCVDATADYRLVYNAGSCDAKASEGSACVVGTCTDGSGSCAEDNDCKSGACQKGYCSIDSDSESTVKNAGKCEKNSDGKCACKADADCSTARSAGEYDTKYCHPTRGICVSKVGNCSTTDQCRNEQNFAGHFCVPTEKTTAGNCFNDRCITGIRDGNSDGIPEPVTKELIDYAQSCRGYPEIDSPFPQKVVKLWKVFPEFNSQEKEANAKATPIDLGVYASLATTRSVPFQFVSGFDASNVCSPYIDNETKQIVISDQCVNTCSYTKAIYAKGSETRYYPADLSVVDGGSVPSGICTGGMSDGKICKSDSECETIDNKNPGTCQLLTAANTMLGWQGYCLEKDTSIQLNGSPDINDRACLTWLPVDQLSGATDLYGKETSAGYQIASSTYFCAQPGIAYDLHSTGENDYACAETNDGNCYDVDVDSNTKDTELKEAFSSDEPHKNIRCPKGYVAFMAPCGDASPFGYCKEKYGDDDYPYFCVPRLSYHTGGALAGKVCKFPGEDPADLKPVPNYEPIGGKTSVTRNAPLNVTLYFSDAEKWKTAKDFYADCVVKGVTDKASLNNYLGTDSPSGVASKGSGPDGPESYRGFNLNAKSYAACQTVAQVGATSLQSGVYNAAWTDRVWQSAQNKYAIKEADGTTVDARFGYTVSSLLAIYGQTLDLDEKNKNPDPDPMRILMCGSGGNVFPKADGTCDVPNAPKTQNEARSYGSFNLFPSQFSVTAQTSYCKDKVNCSCNVSTGVTDCNTEGQGTAPICENAKATCSGGNEDGKSCLSDKQKKDCDDAGGSCTVESGTCKGGPKKDSACTKDSECIVNVCQNSLFLINNSLQLGSYCVDQGVQAGETTIGGFDPAGARARLQQIFARSLEIRNFDDGYSKLVITTPDPSKKNGEYLKMDPAPAGWLWDQRAVANGTKPPVITSVGNCVGNSCSEKTDGKFNVNGFDSGDVQGTGNKHVSVTFYVHADSNQMPLRNIVVDWGDDMKNISEKGNPWPNGKYGGSKEPTNFYKNHRGLSKESAPKEICSDKATEFGLSPEACSSSYVLFSHDYVCTNGDINALSAALRFCGDKDPKTGSIITSPCVKKEGDQQYCVFQPRVHAKDNWGWCTGYCDGGSDKTNSCFDGSLQQGGVNECDITQCPANGTSKICKDDGNIIIDPWTYFDGTIKIKPVQ